jgi:hypothetical protein
VSHRSANAADLTADRLRGVGHQVDGDLMELAGIAEKRRDFPDLLDDLDSGRQARPQHLQGLARHQG